MIINTDYIKTPVALVVGFSVGAVVKRIVQNNALPETTLHSVETWVAATVLGSMAAKAAKEYSAESIDNFVEKHFSTAEELSVPVEQTEE